MVIMFRYPSNFINDNIKISTLPSIYSSLDKYNQNKIPIPIPAPTNKYNTNIFTYDVEPVSNTVILKDTFEKYSFWSYLFIAFLAGYKFRLMIESKNIS